MKRAADGGNALDQEGTFGPGEFLQGLAQGAQAVYVTRWFHGHPWR